jgi:hypothetical protein
VHPSRVHRLYQHDDRIEYRGFPFHRDRAQQLLAKTAFRLSEVHFGSDTAFEELIAGSGLKSPLVVRNPLGVCPHRLPRVLPVTTKSSRMKSALSPDAVLRRVRAKGLMSYGLNAAATGSRHPRSRPAPSPLQSLSNRLCISHDGGINRLRGPRLPVLWKHRKASIRSVNGPQVPTGRPPGRRQAGVPCLGRLFDSSTHSPLARNSRQCACSKRNCCHHAAIR